MSPQTTDCQGVTRSEQYRSGPRIPIGQPRAEGNSGCLRVPEPRRFKHSPVTSPADLVTIRLAPEFRRSSGRGYGRPWPIGQSPMAPTGLSLSARSAERCPRALGECTSNAGVRMGPRAPERKGFERSPITSDTNVERAAPGGVRTSSHYLHPKPQVIVRNTDGDSGRLVLVVARVVETACEPRHDIDWHPVPRTAGDPRVPVSGPLHRDGKPKPRTKGGGSAPD